MKTRLFVLVVGVAAMAVGSASAHHSFAMYEREKTVVLSGTVKEFVWTSPHVAIQVVTDNARGALVTWLVEGSSPTVLARGGWTSTLLKPGDKISLGIHPRKDGGAGGLLADEQQVLINGQPARGVLSLQPAGEEACER
jgi:Family of unknown function (DUF6152)